MRSSVLAFALFAAGSVPAAAQGGTLVYQVDMPAVTRALYRTSIEAVREMVGEGPEVTAVDDGVLVTPQPGDRERVDAALAIATEARFGFEPAEVEQIRAAGVWPLVARRMYQLGVSPGSGYSSEPRGDDFVVRTQHLAMDPTMRDWVPLYLRDRVGRVAGVNSVEPAPEPGRYLVHSELDVDALRSALDRRSTMSINRVAREPGEGVSSVPLDPEAMGGDASPLLAEVEPIVTGADVLLAQATFDPYIGQPMALLMLTDEGARRLGEATQASVGLPLAIVLDGKVISAPVVQEPIMHGVVQIIGRFTPETAEDLAVRLQSAADPGAILRVGE